MLALLCWLLLRGGSGDLAPDGNRGKAAAGKSGASHSLRWSGGSGPAGAPEPVGTRGGTVASLRGRVLDAIDGKPVPSAIVALRARGGDILDETATDDDGTFAFAGIEPLVRVVSVQADGYAFLTQPLVDFLGRRAIDTTNGAALELMLDPAVRVEGRVVDPSGRGIPGADVWVEDHEGRRRWPRPVSDIASSDLDGRFTIHDAPSGSLFAHARASGRTPGKTEIGSAGPGRTRDGIVISLPDGGSIRGRVFDVQGAPVAGAKVVFSPGRGRGLILGAESAPVTSDPDGAFLIDSLAEGSGFLAASSEEGSGVVETGVKAGNETHADVKLESTGSVAGRVIDGRDAPLQGATVAVAGAIGDPESMARNAAAGFTIRSASTDSEGRFRIEGLSGDMVTLSASGEGMGQQRVEVKVGETNVGIRLSGVDLAVSVVTADGAKPEGKVQVTAAPGESRKLGRPLFPRVSKDGTFHFAVTPGEWEIFAKANGYRDPKPVSLTVMVGSDPAPVTIRLGPQGVVRGTLVSDSGKTVAGARISFTEPGGNDPRGGEKGGSLDWGNAVRSRSDGGFELAGASGDGRLFVYHPEYEPELVPVLVPETGAIDVGLVSMRAGKGTSSVSEFVGIGVVITGDDETSTTGAIDFVVRSVLPGSPAERAGVRAADHLLEIDGQATKSMALNELVNRIRGPVGTTVTLLLKRPENFTPLQMDVLREKSVP